MNTKYLDYISTAAFKNYEIVDGLSLKIVETAFKERWLELEAIIKPRKYDVLECISARPIVKNLIKILYHAVPGAHFAADVETLHEKEKEYGGSWAKRGGVGAFFVAVRKYDRIMHQLAHWKTLANALEKDRRHEGIRDDLNDLRCYLILWEAWWLAL